MVQWIEIEQFFIPKKKGRPESEKEFRIDFPFWSMMIYERTHQSFCV